LNLHKLLTMIFPKSGRMKHRPVPVGSTWVVLPYPPQKHRETGVQTWGLSYLTSPDNTFTGRMTGIGEFPPGTVIIVGQTHTDSGRALTPDGSPEPSEFVEVLLPIRCYVNRICFDPRSTSLSPIDET